MYKGGKSSMKQKLSKETSNFIRAW